MSNKHALRDAFLSPQQVSTKMTRSDLRNVENNTEYRKGTTEEKNDSESDEIEDRETDKALQWLEVEWESLAKILRRTRPEMYWENVY